MTSFQMTSRSMTLWTLLWPKNSFLDFVAAGGIVFHKHTLIVFSGLHPHQTSTPAPGMGHGYFHPALTQGQNFTQDIIFSGKHNGICLYLARIIRWVFVSLVKHSRTWGSLPSVCLCVCPVATLSGIKMYLEGNFNDHRTLYIDLLMIVFMV